MYSPLVTRNLSTSFMYGADVTQTSRYGNVQAYSQSAVPSTYENTRRDIRSIDKIVMSNIRSQLQQVFRGKFCAVAMKMKTPPEIKPGAVVCSRPSFSVSFPYDRNERARERERNGPIRCANHPLFVGGLQIQLINAYVVVILNVLKALFTSTPICLGRVSKNWQIRQSENRLT